MLSGIGAIGEGGIGITVAGLGSTGRASATNLVEQLAMEEVKRNPGIGTAIIKELSDPRWPGWTKMQYLKDTYQNGQVVIHYVAKYAGDVIKQVDDFKFK
jgi:hypothetical protein